jgi:hypothetical protein
MFSGCSGWSSMNSGLPTYSSPSEPDQQSNIQHSRGIHAKANKPIVRTVHQQYRKQDKRFMERFYISLRSHRREDHENRS